MAEAEDILRQIYLSEVDYAHAKQLRALLMAKPSRTPEEDAQLGRLDVQIAHDDDVIGRWIARIALLRGRTPVQVRAALDNPLNRSIRDAALESWRKQAEDDAAEERAKAADMAALPTTPEFVRDAFVAVAFVAGQTFDIEKFRERITEKERLALDHERRVQEREARRDRIAVLKLQAKCEWSP